MKHYKSVEFLSNFKMSSPPIENFLTTVLPHSSLLQGMHRGITCNLLRLLPDRHKVHMIIEMVGNRSSTSPREMAKRSRLRRLKNGVPQGSVLAALLFKICISDPGLPYWRIYRQIPEIWQILKAFGYRYFGLAIWRVSGDFLSSLMV